MPSQVRAEQGLRYLDASFAKSAADEPSALPDTRIRTHGWFLSSPLHSGQRADESGIGANGDGLSGQPAR